MHIIAIQASPNVDGLTATAARSALRGASEVGAHTELIHLKEDRYVNCAACDNGWGRCREEGLCVQDDDLASLRQRLSEADAIVVSTPVYFGEVAEVVKVIFDRLRRCEWAKGENGLLNAKPTVGISAAGGSGGGAVSALAMLERYAQGVGMVCFDLITLTQRSREHKLPMLEAAGERLVEFVRERG